MCTFFLPSLLTRLAAALCCVRLIISRVPSHLSDSAARAPIGTAEVLTPLAARLGDCAPRTNVSTGDGSDTNPEDGHSNA
ncbi:hypothetical protein THAOC_10758 [Thalassiosira oceanica]|uniref:Secreted protein n=1 Tax=Thalassiosira oceanica TaxID=159749 RepID=K0ST13_THAOC|nr:hypothetical protein THAOC_10758 [Thalassiosira oceanica]|eukprot:EJK68099.1 hypothetical protein THAOC_10758 [Thalassiosira oceanica]